MKGVNPFKLEVGNKYGTSANSCNHCSWIKFWKLIVQLTAEYWGTLNMEFTKTEKGQRKLIWNGYI